MANRITSAQVTFQRPFLLTGFVKLQAAGTYTVDTEEEQITGLTFPAWKRTGMIIQIARAGVFEHVPVDPAELHEALMRDGAQENPAHPASPGAGETRRNAARNTRLVTRKKF
ncbi:MAG TPA: hypothetical protein VHL34_01860 [Rhizomicrobium sp.]|nr:hypothetical protein [Rhizomicrobium sp.]